MVAWPSTQQYLHCWLTVEVGTCICLLEDVCCCQSRSSQQSWWQPIIHWLWIVGYVTTMKTHQHCLLTVLHLHHETPFKFLTFCTIMMRHVPGCIVQCQLVPSSCACFLSLGLYSRSSRFCMFRTSGQEVGTDTCEVKGKLRKEVGLSGCLPFRFLWPEKLRITSWSSDDLRAGVRDLASAGFVLLFVLLLFTHGIYFLPRPAWVKSQWGLTYHLHSVHKNSNCVHTVLYQTPSFVMVTFNLRDLVPFDLLTGCIWGLLC